MLVFALLARLVSCANVVHDRYYIHISRLSMFTLQLVMLQLGFFSTNKQDPFGNLGLQRGRRWCWGMGDVINKHILDCGERLINIAAAIAG